MTRADVLTLIRSHLAEELQVDPDTVVEETDFRRDLLTDSLDLLALTQELEDAYGIRIPEEQAAAITTVGQAVDFVVEHVPSTG